MREDLLYGFGAGRSLNPLKKDEIEQNKGMLKQKLNFLYDNSHKLCAVLSAREPEISVEMIAKFLLNNHLVSQNRYYKEIVDKLSEYEQEDRFEEDVRAVEEIEEIKELVFCKLEQLIFILTCVDQTVERNIGNLSEYSDDVYFQKEFLKILLNLHLQIRASYFSRYPSPFHDEEAVKRLGNNIVENSDFTVSTKNSELAAMISKKEDVFSDPVFAKEILQGFLRLEKERKWKNEETVTNRVRKP